MVGGGRTTWRVTTAFFCLLLITCLPYNNSRLITLFLLVIKPNYFQKYFTGYFFVIYIVCKLLLRPALNGIGIGNNVAFVDFNKM